MKAKIFFFLLCTNHRNDFFKLYSKWNNFNYITVESTRLVLTVYMFKAKQRVRNPLYCCTLRQLTSANPHHPLFLALSASYDSATSAGGNNYESGCRAAWQHIQLAAAFASSCSFCQLGALMDPDLSDATADAVLVVVVHVVVVPLRPALLRSACGS